MQAVVSILDRIRRRQLKLYGQLLRMYDIRWTEKIYRSKPYDNNDDDDDDDDNNNNNEIIS